MHFRQAILAIDDKTYALTPNRANSFDELHVDFQQTEQEGGTRFSIFLHPKQDITVKRLEVQFDLPLQPTTRVFANGYQSRSESRLRSLQEGIPKIRKIAEPYFGRFGDDGIGDIPRGPGYAHSWTYMTVDGRGSTPAFGKPSAGKVDGVAPVLLTGSLTERTGFTLFLCDQPNSLLTVKKDLDNFPLAHSFPVLDFWTGEGPEQDVYERYFRAMELPPPEAETILLWSAGNGKTNPLSEKYILQHLDNVINSKQPFTHFLIDEGWQTEVGDWLSIRPEFPNGLGRLAGAIREKGLKAGLGLSPFVASAKSELVKRNPKWLLTDKKGHPLKAGWNPDWGGWFYALDFYNPQVRDYLSGIFHVVLDTWGFELLKLDFLFAACLAPPPGKTRGQVMFEAMEFLRKQVGNRKILACGVPLGAAFGQVDYCQVGADIPDGWESRLQTFLKYRERPGALSAIQSTIGRHPLNERAFFNAPGQFILRNDHAKWTPAQQNTVLTINNLLGDLLSTNDDLSKYTPEQMSELEEALDWRGALVQSIRELQTNVFCMEIFKTAAGLSLDPYMLYTNLNQRSVQVQVKQNDWIMLEAFETMVLKS